MNRLYSTRVLCFLGITLILAGCNPKSPTLIKSSPQTSSKPGGSTNKTNGLLGGKITVTGAEVGPPTTLTAWLFGPLESASALKFGVASTVSSNGTYSFPAQEPGTYRLQFGHTWATPQNTANKDGKTIRGLDYPCKITPNNAAVAEDVNPDGVLTVKVTADLAALPNVTITDEPFPSTWDTKGFVPAPGQALPQQASVEFNIIGHPAAKQLGLVVHAGSKGSGQEVFSDQKIVSGHTLWRGVQSGAYSYQATSYLVSGKNLTTDWIDFTVGQK